MEKVCIELDNETILKIEKLATQRQISMDELLNETVRILVSISESDPVYDIKQVAPRLGTTERHVRALIRQDRNPLPYFKLGRKLRFRETEVACWMDSGLTAPARRARAKFPQAA